MIKKLIQGVLIGLLFSGAALTLWSKGWLDRWEYATWNWRVAVRAAPGPATEDIKVIVLDQASLDWAAREMGLSWPWPREVYAPLIEFCLHGGARAVAFDVLYTEPSGSGVEDDEVLGTAIREGPPFTLAAFLGAETGKERSWPEVVPDRSLRIDGLEAWLARRDAKDIVMPRATFPIPELATNVVMVADVKGSPDPDGIIRRANVFRVFDGKAVPSLGLSAYLAAQYQRNGVMPRARIEGNTLYIGRRVIPMDEKGRSILRYRGPSGTHQKFTAAQVIQSAIRIQQGEEPALSPVVFDNAYVFFGFSAPGLLDLRPTPLSPVTPGVEVHTTILDNVLSNAFLRELPEKWVFVTTILLAILAACAARFTQKAWHSVVAFVVFLPIPWLLSLFFYDLSFSKYDFSYWWPVMVQTIAVLLSLIGAVVVNYAMEGRQKAFIKGAFKHYLSPDVIEQIMKNPDQLRLGGERRELSIFFSDLQGFSSISEKMEPQDLTRLLNDYLTDMTDIILEEGGTLDKYEGDAIIAFWNAPLNQADHAQRACRTAIRCQRKLEERRNEFKERTGVELHMRIGINTGQVVVGNMGSRERFDYTVLGDAANLAARLEGANKFFGTYTMVAEETWNQAQGSLVGRCIGRMRVVGRKTPVRVFEPLGMQGETPAISPERFDEAVGLCEEERWADAIAKFNQWPDDPLSKSYAQKCRQIMETKGATWDGIWNLTEK